MNEMHSCTSLGGGQVGQPMQVQQNSVGRKL